MRNIFIAVALLLLPTVPTLAQHAPFAGAALEPHSKDPAVVKAESAAEKLDKQLKAKPKDSALKMKVAEAYYKAGFTLEYSKALGSKTRYRGALKLYRKALALNPKHAAATKEKNQIEE